MLISEAAPALAPDANLHREGGNRAAGLWLQPVARLSRDVLLAAVMEGDRAADRAGPASMPEGISPPYGTVLLESPAGTVRLAAYCAPLDVDPPQIATRPSPFGGELSPFLFDDLLFQDEPRQPVAVAKSYRDTPLPSLRDTGHSLRDAGALAEMLDFPSRRRLLDFLLGFCRTAFRLSQDREFSAMCARIGRFCCDTVGTAALLADVLPGRVLLKGAVVPPGHTLYLVGPAGARLARAARQHVAPVGAETGAADLQVIGVPLPGDQLLAIGTEIYVWALELGSEHDPPTRPSVLTLSGAELVGARAACLRAFTPAAPGSPEMALLQELHALAPATVRQHDDPSLPIGGALEVALPDGDGGLFLAGWLRDPLELIAGAELITPAGRQKIAFAALHRIARPDLSAMLAKVALAEPGGTRPGFVARVPDPTGGATVQPTLRLRLRSGATTDLTPPWRPLTPQAARNAVLSSVRPQDVRPEIFDECLVPVATALHRQARAQRGAARVVRLGRRLARPAVSILIPLYRVLGFLRFQLAAFSEDSACRSSEIIYALDSPEQANEVEQLLRGLQHLYELPLTLVVLERNSGFAAATNAAAGQAGGQSVLLLNSDVVPARPGWLEALQSARASAEAVAATPKLLFEDGSLQHAGLYFVRDSEGRWFNTHYHKGRPRGWPGSDTPRPVPGGTGAALLIDRAQFESVGGVCEDYIIGDYEDSDLCLRLQAAGGRIVYEPRAELFHFERRSIALHPGYKHTLACQYNRHLHQQRWAGAMAELMDRAEFRDISAIGEQP
jgi:GT2 family glycosyltransferase